MVERDESWSARELFLIEGGVRDQEGSSWSSMWEIFCGDILVGYSTLILVVTTREGGERGATSKRGSTSQAQGGSI